MVNNAIKHNFSRQEFVGELTGCSAYFTSSGKANSARAMLHGCDVLLFKLSEAEGAVDVIITIPNDFSSIHYFRNQCTTDGITKDAHLTYHGHPKRKKMTGEIHLVNDGQNRFSGQSNRVAAPLSISSDIKTHPLPICRIELNLQAEKVKPRNSISNFFELHPGNVFFNTILLDLVFCTQLHHARLQYVMSWGQFSSSLTCSLSMPIPCVGAQVFTRKRWRCKQKTTNL